MSAIMFRNEKSGRRISHNYLNSTNNNHRGDIMSLIDNEHQLPEGLGFRLALDMEAMTNFANLPEDKKDQLVNYIQSSTSGEDAKRRVSEVVSSLHKGDTFR